MGHRASRVVVYVISISSTHSSTHTGTDRKSTSLLRPSSLQAVKQTSTRLHQTVCRPILSISQDTVHVYVSLTYSTWTNNRKRRFAAVILIIELLHKEYSRILYMLSTARRCSCCIPPFKTVFPHLYALLTASLVLGLSSRLVGSQNIL